MSAFFGVMCDGQCQQVIPSPLSVSDARQMAREHGWIRQVNPDRSATDVFDICDDCKKIVPLRMSSHPKEKS